MNRWVTDPPGQGRSYWKHAYERQARDIPIFVDCAHWHLRPEDDNRLPTQGRFLDGSSRRIPLWTLWDLRRHREFKKRHYTKERFAFPW